MSIAPYLKPSTWSAVPAEVERNIDVCQLVGTFDGVVPGAESGRVVGTVGVNIHLPDIVPRLSIIDLIADDPVGDTIPECLCDALRGLSCSLDAGIV